MEMVDFVPERRSAARLLLGLSSRGPFARSPLEKGRVCRLLPGLYQADAIDACLCISICVYIQL